MKWDDMDWSLGFPTPTFDSLKVRVTATSDFNDPTDRKSIQVEVCGGRGDDVKLSQDGKQRNRESRPESTTDCGELGDGDSNQERRGSNVEKRRDSVMTLSDTTRPRSVIRSITEDSARFRAILLAYQAWQRHVDDDENALYKSVLIKACEAGYEEIVDFVVRQNVDLEAIDDEGNTALMCAMHHGHGSIARTLVRAGASLTVRNQNDRQSSQLIDRKLRLGLTSRARNIELLDEIAELCEFQQSAAEASAKLAARWSHASPARALNGISDSTSAHDDTEAIGATMRACFDTHVSDGAKTISYMTSGAAEIPVFAVSGWPCALLPSHIEDLSNTHLERKIFQLVDIIMHDLPLSFKDHGVEGRFLACNAEKQLLTYLIWHRTNCLDNGKTLDLQDVGTLEHSLIRIYVYQPAQAKPQVCDDCLAFCSEVAMTFGFRLQLWAVGEKNTYLYRSWPG